VRLAGQHLHGIAQPAGLRQRLHARQQAAAPRALRIE
jgi:hypothetical protein